MPSWESGSLGVSCLTVSSVWSGWTHPGTRRRTPLQDCPQPQHLLVLGLHTLHFISSIFTEHSFRGAKISLFNEGPTDEE